MLPEKKPLEKQVPERLTLVARGLPLAALRWHAGASCRVLCLHGWLDNAASFSVLAPLLPDCECVAIDLPGHGESAHRGMGTMQHFVEYVADVIAVLDALGWQDCVLLGHSMGAGIAALVAAVYPERVRALLLVEGLGAQVGTPEKIVAGLRTAIDAGRRGSAESAGYQHLDEAVAARNKTDWPLGDAAARLLLSRSLTAAADGRFRWHTDPRLRQPSAMRLTATQLTTLLGAIRAPTLLIGGTRGLYASPAAHQTLIAAVSGLVVAVLEGTHHLHLEPETAPMVAEALRGHLRGLALC